MARRRDRRRIRGRSSIPTRVAIVGAVAVIGVEVVALGLKSSHPRSGSTVLAGDPAASAATTLPVTPPTSALASDQSQTGGAGTGTTVAGSTSTTRVVRAPGSTSYVLPGTATVVVTTTKATWMEVRPTKDGRVISVDTLQPGQSRTYPTPVWIRFGDPSGVTVTANGDALSVPTKGGPTDLSVSGS